MFCVSLLPLVMATPAPALLVQSLGGGASCANNGMANKASAMSFFIFGAYLLCTSHARVAEPNSRQKPREVVVREAPAGGLIVAARIELVRAKEVDQIDPCR